MNAMNTVTSRGITLGEWDKRRKLPRCNRTPVNKTTPQDAMEIYMSRRWASLSHTLAK